jgi:acetyl-CoA carboxylase alpha subunit
LRLTAEDLQSLALIDEIIPEPPGGAQEDPAVAADNLRVCLARHLTELSTLSATELVDRRYTKFRQMGNFFS